MAATAAASVSAVSAAAAAAAIDATTAAATPDRLSREVLKWLQSLDLAYAVKNVRRDFANGFLIAEVLSRYDERSFGMHSFDNGTSIRTRRDNWALLSRALARRGFALSQREVDDVIHCRPGAAPPLINRLFTFLTQRRVQEPPRRPAAPAPPFMMPTAAAIAHEVARTAPVLEDEDELLAERATRDAISAHEAALQAQKQKDPDRFAPRAKPRMATRVVDAGAPTVSVTVKTITVRQIDKSVSRLRADREATSRSIDGGGGAVDGGPSAILDGPPSPSSVAGGHAASALMSSSSAPGAASTASPLDLLNRIAHSQLAGGPYRDALDPKKPPFLSFVHAVRFAEDPLPDEVAVRLLADAAQRAAAIADAAASHPRHYWRLYTTVGPLYLNAKPTGPGGADAVATAAIDLLCAVASCVADRDAALALSLFVEFGLPQLASSLSRAGGSAATPQLRAAAARLLYAHCSDDSSAHIQAIRSLKDALGTGASGMEHLLRLLPSIVQLERAMSHHLLDLVLYYCVIGLSQSQPSLRSASLAVLAHIAQHVRGADGSADDDDARAAAPPAGVPLGVRLVAQVSDSLTSLCADPNWEVQAQVVRLCCAALSALPPTASAASSSTSAAAASSLASVDAAPADGSVDDSLTVSSAALLFSGMLHSVLLGPGSAVGAAAPCCSQPALAVALLHMSPLLLAWPDLRGLYAGCLLNMSAVQRSRVMCLDQPAPSDLDAYDRILLAELGGVAPEHAGLPLAALWDGLGVTLAMVDHMQSAGAENLDMDHMEILAAAIVPCATLAAYGQAWASAIDALQDLLFLALCDPDCSAHAIAILEKLLTESTVYDAMLKSNSLVSTMRLLFPTDGSGDQQCQSAFLDLLRRCATRTAGSPSLAQCVAALLGIFSARFGQHVTAHEGLREIVAAVAGASGK